MRRPVLAVFVLAPLAAAGCSSAGSGGAGATLPPVTPSESTSTSSATAQPSVTADAADASVKGVEQFLRSYYSALTTAYRSGDSAFVRQLSTPDCDSCLRIYSSIDSLRENRLSVQDYAISVDEVAVAAVSDLDTVTNAVVIFSATAYVERDSRGTVVRRQEAIRRVVQDVRLLRAGGTWRVSRIDGRS